MIVIDTIFKTPWGISRWLRLAIGLAFLFDAYSKNSGMVAFMGAFLAYQAVFNIGCGLGNSTCGAEVSLKKDIPNISHNFIQLKDKK